jgi:hypothetical protein
MNNTYTQLISAAGLKPEASASKCQLGTVSQAQRIVALQKSEINSPLGMNNGACINGSC